MSFSEQTQYTLCLHGKCVMRTKGSIAAAHTMDGGWQKQRQQSHIIVQGKTGRRNKKSKEKVTCVLWSCTLGVATYVLLLYITALGLINNTP